MRSLIEDVAGWLAIGWITLVGVPALFHALQGMN